MYPLHVGAQQLQLQIEEERYRKTEEERQQRLDQERKTRQEKDRQVDEYAKKIDEHIEKEELAEAQELLKKIYTLDPNFTAGERIEEKLRRAEAAKLERERQQAYLEEEKQREELIAQNQERQLEREQKRVQHQKEQETSPKSNLKPIIWSSAIVIVAILAYLVYPQLKRTFFPVSASIAFLPLNDSQANQSEEPLRFVIPAIIAQDLAHVERVQVVVPTRLGSRAADYQTIAGNLQVRYLLHGNVIRTEHGFSLSLRLFDTEQNSDIFSRKFESDFLALNKTRQGIADAVLEATKMEATVAVIPVQTTGPLAYEKYVNGLYLLGFPSSTVLDQAAHNFEESASIDSTFASAYAGMAEARIAKCRANSTADETILREAYDLSQRALRLNPNDAASYRDLAEVDFMTGRFDRVSANIQKSLALQPEDAESYGVLSQLAVVAGNYDLALQNALRAVKVAPDDPYLKIVLGIAQQFKGSYNDANDAFKQAIALGLSDSLVTAQYLLGVWTAQENYSDPIRYYQASLKDFPDDYRYYYWISRAYQMQPSVNEFKTWSQKGRALLSDYLDKNPGNGIGHAYLALFLSREGKADDGIAEMSRALALSPNSTEILFRQADMFAIQKKVPLALGSLRAALNRNYSFSEILNPDFALLRSDTSFASAISRKTAAQ